MRNKIVKKMTFAAMIAAFYFVLCVIEGNLASGPFVNIRFAEGLAVFAFWCPEVALGTAIGCFLYNLLFGGLGIIDAVIGTCATIIGTGAIYFIGKIVKKDWLRVIVFGIPLVLLNAILVPIDLIVCIPEITWEMYGIEFVTVMWGEAIAVYSIGVPLYFGCKKLMDKYFLSEKNA